MQSRAVRASAVNGCRKSSGRFCGPTSVEARISSTGNTSRKNTRATGRRVLQTAICFQCVGNLRHRDENLIRDELGVEDTAEDRERDREQRSVQDGAAQAGSSNCAAAAGAGCGGTNECVIVKGAAIAIPKNNSDRFDSFARFQTSGTRMMKPTSKKIGSPTRNAAITTAQAAFSLPKSLSR